MPYYLGQVAYTHEAIQHMDEHPQNRIEAVRPAYEELGAPSAKPSWPSGTTT